MGIRHEERGGGIEEGGCRSPNFLAIIAAMGMNNFDIDKEILK
jgi:hypothetical protein